MNKRQSLFWSLQFWRYLEKTGNAKLQALPGMIFDHFRRVKIDWDQVFGEMYCPCCSLVIAEKKRESPTSFCSYHSHCENHCPAYSLWPDGCLNPDSIYRQWDNVGPYAWDWKTEAARRKERAKLAGRVADGLERLYLEECQNGN